jgi:hypothetical protein
MLYLVKGKRPVILARFEFKPEEAHRFIDSPNSSQNVIEQVFDDVDELIETTRAFEKSLVDCTAIVNGRMLCLSSFTSK